MTIRPDSHMLVGMHPIRIGVVGVGNCCSSLVQGINYYKKTEEAEEIGLMHREIGGYAPGDIEIVAAFDIDRRKVGKDVSEAIFEKPNCTTAFCRDVTPTGTRVRMGAVLDGCSGHMGDYPEACTFLVSDEKEPDKKEVTAALRDAGVEILLDYLPVGSEQAARFYVECALDAGCALVNNIPVFIASDPAWAARFEAKGLPLIGDDIKSQLRRYDCPPDPGRPFQEEGRQARAHLPDQYRREHRFPEHAQPRKARLEKDVQDRGRTVYRGRAPGRHEHPRRSERLRPMAERQ